MTVPTGLRVLHSLGWVHRDISSGNILVVNGEVKISDLEYAKLVTESSLHGIRTVCCSLISFEHNAHDVFQGTIYFMSIEVDAHKYLHLPLTPPTPVDAPPDLFTHFERLTKGRNPSSMNATVPKKVSVLEDLKTNEARIVPFRYNPLHDMESLFWLALFLLVAGTTVDTGSEFPEITEEQRAAQHQLAAGLFCDTAFRRDVMRSGTLKSSLSALHPRIGGIVLILEAMRSFLTGAFIEAEEDMDEPIDSSVTERLQVYGNLDAEFEKINSHLQADDIIVSADEASYRRLRGALAQKAAQEKTEVIPAAAQANPDGDTEGVPPAKRQRTQNTPSSSSSRSRASAQTQ